MHLETELGSPKSQDVIRELLKLKSECTTGLHVTWRVSENLNSAFQFIMDSFSDKSTILSSC